MLAAFARETRRRRRQGGWRQVRARPSMCGRRPDARRSMSGRPARTPPRPARLRPRTPPGWPRRPAPPPGAHTGYTGPGCGAARCSPSSPWRSDRRHRPGLRRPPRLTPPAAGASRPARCAPGTAAPPRCRGPSRVHSVGDPNRSPTARRGRGRGPRALRRQGRPQLGHGRRPRAESRPPAGRWSTGARLQPRARCAPTLEGDGPSATARPLPCHPPWTSPRPRASAWWSSARTGRPISPGCSPPAGAGPGGTQVVVVANAPSPAQAALLAPGSAVLDPIAGTAPESSGRASAGPRGRPQRRPAAGPWRRRRPRRHLDRARRATRHSHRGGPRGALRGGRRRLRPRLGRPPPLRGRAGAGRRRDRALLAASGEPTTPRRAPHERFAYYRNLDIWWSLVLRAAGTPGRRRAGLAPRAPARAPRARGWTSLPDADRDRLSRRNFYRVLDRFRERRDLLSGRPGASRPTG